MSRKVSYLKQAKLFSSKSFLNFCDPKLVSYKKKTCILLSKNTPIILSTKSQPDKTPYSDLCKQCKQDGDGSGPRRYLSIRHLPNGKYLKVYFDRCHSFRPLMSYIIT